MSKGQKQQSKCFKNILKLLLLLLLLCVISVLLMNMDLNLYSTAMIKQNDKGHNDTIANSSLLLQNPEMNDKIKYSPRAQWNGKSGRVSEVIRTTMKEKDIDNPLLPQILRRNTDKWNKNDNVSYLDGIDELYEYRPQREEMHDIYPSHLFDNCESKKLLDILRIKWHNNTSCVWDFVESDCDAIHKMRFAEVSVMLQILELNNISITFWGDSVTRRTGKTLDVWINHHGDVKRGWRDATATKRFSYAIYHTNMMPHFHTEWTPIFENVTHALENKQYLNAYYARLDQTFFGVIGVGVHEYIPANFPGTVDQVYHGLPERIHTFVKWIYDNYFDKDLQNKKRFYIILRTQTALGINRGQRTRQEFVNLTMWFNENLIKYANMYGIPIFDTYHWSGRQDGYHFGLNSSMNNKREMYDILDHSDCAYCEHTPDAWRLKQTEDRHKCIECDDGNCVHMRMNGRVILLQQILNAVNIIAHNQHLIL